MVNCDECRPLLERLIAHELTSEEISLVNEHLIRCKSCRRAFDEIAKAGNITGSVKEPGDEIMEKLWKNMLGEIAVWSGIVLIIGGYLVFLGYSIYKFLQDRGEPVLPRIASVAVVTGFSILLV